MNTTTVSSKYQIVIPQPLRKSLRLRPGAKLQVFEDGGIIHLIPLRPMSELYGTLPRIDTTIKREPDREL